MLLKKDFEKLLENCVYEGNWDYYGWKNHMPLDVAPNPDTQNDWNATLITKINIASKQLWQVTRNANLLCILASDRAMSVISTMLLYNPKTQTLSSVYKVYGIKGIDPDSLLIVEDLDLHPVGPDSKSAIIRINI